MLTQGLHFHTTKTKILYKYDCRRTLRTHWTHCVEKQRQQPKAVVTDQETPRANCVHKSKANSTMASAQCTTTIVLSMAFLLLINGFRFRIAKTKTWVFRFRSTKTQAWGFRFRSTKTKAGRGFRFRSTKVFVFVVWKRRPCVTKKNCLHFNENFPEEKAYRLLESILDTK